VVEQVPENLKAEIIHWAAFYVSSFDYIPSSPNVETGALFQELRMKVGSKKIFHLEAWVIKVMSLYKVSREMEGPLKHETDFIRILQHFLHGIPLPSPE
jgi:hypothetical protein